MTVTPRRTLRIPDDEWNAGQAKAEDEGDNLTAVLRRLLAGYLAGSRTEYRAVSKTAVGGAPVVMNGLTGNLSAIRRLYPPSHWTLEEYDVSAPRPISKTPVHTPQESAIVVSSVDRPMMGNSYGRNQNGEIFSSAATKFHRPNADDKGVAACSSAIILNGDFVELGKPHSPSRDDLCKRCFPDLRVHTGRVTNVVEHHT